MTKLKRSKIMKKETKKLLHMYKTPTGVQFTGQTNISSVNIRFRGPKWLHNLLMKILKPDFFVVAEEKSYKFCMYKISNTETTTIETE